MFGDVVHARRHRPRHERHRAARRSPSRRHSPGGCRAGSASLVPSPVPPMVTSWTWPRPWPRLTIDSLRVSVHATGRPSSLPGAAEQQLLGVRADLRPEAPPTSGVTTRTASASTPFTLANSSRTPCTCCDDIHWWSRPSIHAAPAARGSSGHGAIRWLTNRPDTTTSQPAKKSSPLSVRHADRRRCRRRRCCRRRRRARRRPASTRGVGVGGEQLVVDDHGVGGIGGGRRGLGDDDRDGLADEADAVGRQQGSGDLRVEPRAHRLEREVGRR